MTSDRPTFSPFWHRVRAMAPRLRPHTQITRQHYRGQRWHVVHDPATNQFYRLSPIAHEFVGLLDGKRTVEDVWNSVLGKHGDAAPTQQEVIQLLSQLYNAGLLAADTAPETEQLLSRGRERLAKRVKQQAIGIMYFRVKLFNPDRYLSWLMPIVKPLLNRWGFLAWCVLLGAALFNILPHWDRLRSGFEDAIAPSQWGWLIAVWVFTKAVHETGHGVICKRFGGQVPEFGAMMLVLLPAPYVDASATWAFPNKWRRMGVGAGGMIFELFLASIAAFVWIATPGDESLTHKIAYNIMLTSSISTVLFNANPLMRFDGYYILSDLLEVPNLMQRSMGMLKHFFKKYIYRIKDSQPPTTRADERGILYTYGILALAYRVFLFFSITLYMIGLSQKLFAIALVLAAWTAAMWFILPVGGWVHWLATNAQLADRRKRAILVSLAMVALGIGFVGLTPMPDRRAAVGVVESKATTGVFAFTDGFVQEVHIRPGQRVAKDEPLFTLISPDIDASVVQGDLTLKQSELELRRAIERNPGAVDVARDRIKAYEDQVAFLRERQRRLVVRAPQAGVVVGADPMQLAGSFVKAGQQLSQIVDDKSIRVTATLSQNESLWAVDLQSHPAPVKLRFMSSVDQVLDGRVERVIEAGQTRLPHAALSQAGGGVIETATDDQTGTEAKRAQFAVYVEPDGAAAWPGLPGERVRLRFSLPTKPLLVQWIDRLHKLVQGKANV